MIPGKMVPAWAVHGLGYRCQKGGCYGALDKKVIQSYAVLCYYSKSGKLIVTDMAVIEIRDNKCIIRNC